MSSPNPSNANLPRSRAGKPDRFQRFTASRSVNPRLDRADHALLALVERYRLMDSEQMHAALGADSPRRTFLYRLQRLFHAEYLTRPPSQLNRWWTRGEPTKHYVYGLGPQGYAALHPDDAGAESTAVLRLRDQRIGASYIEHRLKLTTALLCFEQAAAGEALTFDWSEGDAMRRTTGLPRYVKIATDRSTIELPLNPDAYLTIRDPDQPRPAHFFLEVDNGTEPIERQGRRRWQRTSIHRKFAAYHELAPRKGDTEADKPRRSPFPFRLLTITTTPARMNSMRALARSLDPKGRGSRLFLLTTDDRVQLASPGDVLTKPIWWTPNDDDQPLALID